ncbi:phosphatase PAP2/dual specificity phosphatase family protein [Pseudomonas guariconensis]|uniref:phosphatase PAP2/dual specificity phosphatase family protein n=1 Tax=Pseudomonas TaxID=286 RepID=UPI0003A7A870|nr:MULTISPECIES: phosphatase PAP2/dual specificity phosphatase family protein [Pseudomonas]MBH3359324.1 phosphatase PAP2/dual specificity phosphatase family protein [Pseudomonas guariconensis]MDM9592373.1 phosphatase PAP2/dual specificity phosphatase family protein [Pseudomonas guariconensis]MDM9605200.1 phosphatase PAP2/dual specificity phosphatase family protein [Pseudomonas guariconensis]MDM9610157.1 phosphatase PAP2/dual specificity phosphatase family protein [Pseudomonas guariconensis]MEB
MTREPGLIRRGVLWLLLLGPFFFLSYGLVNNHTATRDDVGSLVFGWEGQTPLWPWTIVPYWSIDLLYGLSFLLPTTRREMDRHALALLTAQVISVGCFLLWPLRFTFERPALDGLFGWLFDVLMGFDKPFNQAPSLHIALLVIIWTMFARHVHRQPWRGLMHGWMALIGVSVLTTWQHHFIDLPTGALAGLVCVWLWPREGELPLRAARLARDPRRWRLALYYGGGALLCAVLALQLAGAWLWLLWPAVSLLMVALNYAVFGAGGFQKGADGRLSNAATGLLAPYLLGAWINSRLWTRKRPQADEVCDGVFLGRIPGAGEASSFNAALDLTAELPCYACAGAFAGKPANGPGQTMQMPAHYTCLPTLDLIVPDASLLRQAAEAIECLRQQGPVLVCCALGYSRSASAVAAWLVHSGRCANVTQAEALIRKARPSVVLHPGHRMALEQLEAQP